LVWFLGTRELSDQLVVLAVDMTLRPCCSTFKAKIPFCT
jgi:hypothetical protein